jgi:hypothetical protein
MHEHVCARQRGAEEAAAIGRHPDDVLADSERQVSQILVGVHAGLRSMLPEIVHSGADYLNPVSLRIEHGGGTNVLLREVDAPERLRLMA